MDYVIDTNYLRRPDLATALQSAAPGDRFVLSDTAVLETMKNAKWESTARRSFQIIAQHPQKIWLAKAPGDLLRAELATGQEMQDITDLPMSGGFRSLLQEIASGVVGPDMAYARSNAAAAQTTLAQQQQNHAANLQGLRFAFDDIRSSIDIAGYRRIADPQQKKLVRLHRIKTLAQASIRKLADLEGKSAEPGNALANGRGILLRYQIGYYCLGFKWAVNNGLDSFPAERATNEIMDLDHALIATYFDAILTEEASVRELRQDILDVLNSNIQFEPAAAEEPLKSPNP
jgi:hypothetical protein